MSLASQFAAEAMVALTAINNVNSERRNDPANEVNGKLNAQRRMCEQSSCKIMHPARWSYLASHLMPSTLVQLNILFRDIFYFRSVAAF